MQMTLLLKVHFLDYISCCLYSTSTLFEKNKLYLEQASIRGDISIEITTKTFSFSRVGQSLHT